MLLQRCRPYLLTILLAATLANGLGTQNSDVMDRASLKVSEDTIVIKAHNARPLEQAVEALREQYGWMVDFEDPPYDSTDPNWRKLHPSAKGVRRINGELFEARIVLPPNTDLVAQPEIVLNKLVSDYAQSKNPGRFVVKKDDNGRYDIVGISVEDDEGNPKNIMPIFDTRITIPKDKRSMFETLRIILNAVELKTGVRVGFGYAPASLLLHTQIRVGGSNTNARQLLAQALDGSGYALIWRLFYEPNHQMYFMNIEFATQMSQDNSGHTTFHNMRLQQRP